jgi:hypothetical protein
MKLRFLFEKLRRSRERFEAAARKVPDELWRTPPQAGAWSAAEVVAHVTMVETLMTGAAAKITRKPPVTVPVWKRFHIPVLLVGWRGMRVETPIPLDTLLLDDREVMLSRLSEQRQRTLSVLEAGRETNLRNYRVQHPFLGSLHYYDWFRTLAEHDVRHAKQLREVMRDVMRDVENSHKIS